jgi:hypothetical protein
MFDTRLPGNWTAAAMSLLHSAKLNELEPIGDA